jgi:acetyl esterase/lipase
MTSVGENGRLGLFVVDVDHPDQVRPVAVYGNSDVDAVQWVGRRLVFSAVDLEQGSGWDRRLGHGLFIIDAAGGRTRELIQRMSYQQVAMGRSNRAPLHVNHVLLFAPTTPDAEEVIVGEYVTSGDAMDHVEPAWLNVVSGVKRPLKAGNVPAHAEQWWFAPDGQPRALSTTFEGRQAIYWRGPGDAEWRQLAEAPRFQLPWLPRVVDAQGRLYVTRTGASGTSHLIQWDPATNQAIGDPISAPKGFDFEGTLLLADGQMVGSRTNAEREVTTWFAPQRRALQQLVDAQWPDHVNRIQCQRCTSADAVVLVSSRSDRDPGQWTLLRRQDTPGGDPNWTAHVLGRAQPGVDPASMATVQFNSIKARDGRTLPVWITRPANAPAGQALPAVVYVHGGPWVRGNHWQWQPTEQFLASRGYLVISPEFRGSMGYGFGLFHAGWKQWGRTMQDDLVDALQWAQQRGLATQQACIVGASYGGYATLMGLVRDADTFRCGAAYVAVSDPLLLLQGSWWMDDDVSSDGRKYDLKMLVGDAVADRDALLAVSPVAQAARIKSPLLLAYGESDTRVPLAHGNRLREAMTAAGNTPEWITYPGEGHSWRKVSTKVDFAQKLEAFLARNLNGPH